VRQHTLEAIKRISRGCAIAAGVPDDLMPVVKHSEHYTPSLYNDPALSARLTGVLGEWFGATNIVVKPPGTGGEDFSCYGRTADKIPICMFNVGAVATDVYADSVKNNRALPSLHSALFAPDPQPTIRMAVTAMTASALDLLGKK
jgi:hippurate hydrolase